VDTVKCMSFPFVVYESINQVNVAVSYCSYELTSNLIVFLWSSHVQVVSTNLKTTAELWIRGRWFKRFSPTRNYSTNLN
jgi:hypothetical protein